MEKEKLKEKPEELMNPYSRMRMYFEPEEEFYGSQHVVARLLEGISAFPQPKHFELIGLPGMGKTTLLRYLAHRKGAFMQRREYLHGRFRDSSYQFFPIHVEFRHILTGMDVLVYLYHRFFEEHRRREDLRPSELPDLGENPTREATVQSLRKACKDMARSGIRPVFLLDDFDLPFERMSLDDASGFGENLRPLREHVVFVITTEQRLDEVNLEATAGSPFFTELMPIEFTGLEPDDAERLVREPAEKEGHLFPEEDRNVVLEQAGRIPSLLFRGCEALWELRRTFGLEPDAPLPDKHRDVLLGQLRREFRPVFNMYWHRLNEKERTVLTSLAQSPEQLTSGELEVLYNLETKRGLVAHSPDPNRYGFFSPLFAEYVRDMADTASASTTPTLTGLETSLYEYLRDHSNGICTFEDLHREIWNHSMGESDEEREQAKRRVQVAISRLRSKLRELSGEEIISIRDEGYRLISRVSINR